MNLNMYEIFFYCVYCAILMSATMVVVSRNPVIAVLSLILTFVLTACIWLLQGAEFLAMILIVVYVGAVMVLFLFVVMMLDINSQLYTAKLSKLLPVAVMILGSFSYMFYKLVSVDKFSIPFSLPPGLIDQLDYSNTQAVAEQLFTKHLLQFELAGLILLVGIVSAIGLISHSGRRRKMQNVDSQLRIRSSDRLTIVPGDQV